VDFQVPTGVDCLSIPRPSATGSRDAEGSKGNLALPSDLRFNPHFFILASLAIVLLSVTASIYMYLRGPGVGVGGNPLLDPAPAYTVNRLMSPLR